MEGNPRVHGLYYRVRRGLSHPDHLLWQQPRGSQSSEHGRAHDRLADAEAKLRRFQTAIEAGMSLRPMVCLSRG
jgi:hypothetical protein